MSKLEAVGIRSERTTNQLMSQTNPKHRHVTFNQFLHSFNGIGQTCRVTGTIREKDAVGVQRQHIFRRSIRRDNGHIRAIRRKMAKDVFFDTKIVGNNVVIGNW